MKGFHFFVMLGLIAVWACERPIYNPSAPGFDLYNSDPEAVKIADKVMEAMGGRRAWDQTRYISWNFFGRRHLVWDKETGQVRIDAPQDSLIILMNIHTESGKVQHQGKMVSHPDSLKQFLDRGRRIWINDSYWLVMPFKLKDSGVTLSLLREEELPDHGGCFVLELRFEAVGVTPQNKYEVWVDQDDYLVKQWAFYPEADQSEPRSIWPWDNYQTYGKILLSGDRSDGKGPKDIQVFDTLDVRVFEAWEVPGFVKL